MKFISIIIWIFSIQQSEINFFVIALWILAFLLMNYCWSFFFASLSLISVISYYNESPYIHAITAFLVIGIYLFQKAVNAGKRSSSSEFDALRHSTSP